MLGILVIYLPCSAPTMFQTCGKNFIWQLRQALFSDRKEQMGRFSNVRERGRGRERGTRLLDALNNLFGFERKEFWTHWIFMSRPCSRPTWRSCSLPTWKCYTNGVIHQTAFLLYDTEWAEERLEQDEQRNARSVSRTSDTINLKIKLLFMARKKTTTTVWQMERDKAKLICCLKSLLIMMRHVFSPAVY